MTKIYTITQLNREARTLLEGNFPLLWIEGEISNLARPSSGHIYFSLKDAATKVNCAMFQTRSRHVKCSLDNGIKVLVQARVSLYEPRGDFQLIIERLEESGEGILRQRFEALKQKLDEEGLFDSTCKKPLPQLPGCIGVVTSPSGAAIRDILSVLKRRFPYIPVIIYPTSVQGADAAPQIVKALTLANLRKECDVIILARGGGSLEDLWPFNEESVARAIFASVIPTVSGVGHEIDITIADLVADQRAPTPSVAAEMVSPNREEWQFKLQHAARRMHQILHHFLQYQHQLLQGLIKRLRHPGQILQEKAQRLDEMEQRLKRAIVQQLKEAKNHLAHLARTLETVSPLSTLHRGYAIVSRHNSGEILLSAKEVKPGDRVVNRLHQGVLECTVEACYLEK